MASLHRRVQRIPVRHRRHRFFTKVAPCQALERDAGDDFLRRPRSRRIYYRDGSSITRSSPLNAPAIWACGRVPILVSCLWSKMFPIRHWRSFADWVSNRFGANCSDFFETYTRCGGFVQPHRRAMGGAENHGALLKAAVSTSCARGESRGLDQVVTSSRLSATRPGMCGTPSGAH